MDRYPVKIKTLIRHYLFSFKSVSDILGQHFTLAEDTSSTVSPKGTNEGTPSTYAPEGTNFSKYVIRVTICLVRKFCSCFCYEK